MTTPAEIIEAASIATNTSREEITGPVRTQRVSYARFLAMLIYAEENPWSSNRDAANAVHRAEASTGLWGLRRARQLMETDQQFQTAYRKAKLTLASR